MDLGTNSYGVEDVQVLNQTNKLAEMDRVKRLAKGKLDSAAIDEAAKEFESVFLAQMLQHMFQDVDFDPMSDGGTSEDIYKSMLIDEYGKILSRAGGIGVADHVKREMLKLQEVE
ncbi:MAG: rod-binding protein [Rickettsiales bacterium]|nr:rod-binding protein [Rickettsiales bacterium]